MSVEVDRLNSSQRAQEKHLSRLRDEKRLRSGEVSREQLWRENSMFHGFDVARAKIVSSRGRPWSKVTL